MSGGAGEGVELRAATPADVPVFLDLVDALADYEQLARPDAAARERLVRDGFGPQPRFRVLLALVDGAPAGYAFFFETYSSFLARPTMYLEDLFVRPEARGRGAGLALIRAVAREAVARECGRMEWTVLTWNRLAIDFYERLGARPLEEWRTWRLDGDALGAFGT
ncbi:MAG TPA: GNAT family N-acetyltransferase [Gemmatimonadales bacterium]|nr:GNAT family N-acetyltransferase [Gemmatimonadales bacterium]